MFNNFTFSLVFAFFLLLLLLVHPARALHFAPEQIHLAFGQTPDYVTVQWSTRSLEDLTSARSDPAQQPRSLVAYGLDPAHLDRQAEGLSVVFVDSGPRKRRQLHHVVNMTGLAASTRYWYCVGDASLGGLSPVYSFKTAPDAATLSGELPLRLAVWGDMGVDKNGSTVLRHVLKHVHRDADVFDAIIHVGDFAYDMDELDGLRGDLFMRQIEPLAARVPYMTDMGNHEKSYIFSHYTERFRNMPVSDGDVSTDNGPAPNNWWYSFNLGGLHLVAVSTEIYDFGPYEYIERQYRWLEEDLRRANANRTLAPWIIVHGHKPLYCSSPTPENCDSWYESQREGVRTRHAKGNKRQFGLEALFYSYGVDVYLCGHEHNSERHFDIAPGGKTTRSMVDMPATTYIVTGAGGNREDNTPFESEQPPRVASRAEIWGYSVLEVHNATHLYYEQRACDHHEGEHDRDKLVDSVWLVQTQHGSFEVRAMADEEAVAAPA